MGCLVGCLGLHYGVFGLPNKATSRQPKKAIRQPTTQPTKSTTLSTILVIRQPRQPVFQVTAEKNKNQPFTPPKSPFYGLFCVCIPASWETRLRTTPQRGPSYER